MALALGLDVGGTKILGVAFDPSGAVFAECKRPAFNSREAILEGLEEVAVELSLSIGEGVRELVGVGIGVPGSRGSRWRDARSGKSASRPRTVGRSRVGKAP